MVSELITTIQGSIAMELQQIPAFPSATPTHGTIVVVQRASVAIGSGFGMGHHSLQRDRFGTPSKMPGQACSFLAKTGQLQRTRSLRPRIRHASHASHRQSHAVGVAAPGVGWQVDVVSMQAMHLTIPRHDRVVVTWSYPAIVGGGPVQINGRSHRLDRAISSNSTQNPWSWPPTAP